MLNSLRFTTKALFAASLLSLPAWLSAATGFQNFSDVTYTGSEKYYDVGASQGSASSVSSGVAGYYQSGSALFYNQGGPSYSWYGFTYSKEANTTASDYVTGQYCAITGGGANADLSVNVGGSYGIGYYSAWDETPGNPSLFMELDLAANERIDSIAVTNVNVAYYVMRDGNLYANKFEAGDWFKLTVHALDSTMTETSSVDFYLADFRGVDHYILDDWALVDLSSFDDATRFLSFSFESSDTGAYGINTPTYVALGGINVAAIPEPSSIAGGLLILAAVVLRRRR